MKPPLIWQYNESLLLLFTHDPDRATLNTPHKHVDSYDYSFLLTLYEAFSFTMTICLAI